MKQSLKQAEAIEGLLAVAEATVRPADIAAIASTCIFELFEQAEWSRGLLLAERVQQQLGDRLDGVEGLQLGVLKVRLLNALERPEEAAAEAARLRQAYARLRDGCSEEWNILRAMEGSVLWRANRFSESISTLEALSRELARHTDSPATCICALELFSAHVAAGHLAAARDAVLEAYVASRRCEIRYWQALSLLYMSTLERLACRWAAATELLQRALDGFTVEGSAYHVRWCRRLRAITDLRRGHLVSALSEARTAADEARADGVCGEHRLALLIECLALTHMGQFAEATSAVVAAENVLPGAGATRSRILIEEYSGDICLESGDARGALQHYQASMTIASALMPQGDLAAELPSRIAEAHLLLNEPEIAIRGVTESIARCKSVGERYAEGAMYRVLAMAYAACGRNEECNEAFQTGFAAMDEIETPYEWGKLWMSFGDWLASDAAGGYRNPSAAREAYEAARDHFERIGAEFRLGEARQRLEAHAERMRQEGEGYVPTSGKVRPARRPRHGAETLRRAQWALETFGLVTRSAPLLTMLEEIASVAASDLPVLILGESGTGKELVAKSVHALSGRTGEFVAVNCSAVPETMLEGEFFGYVKGAFTSAVADKPGLFEVAHDGTVFLDEIGEMSPDLQAKLLRFLETGSVRRVGATRDLTVDTRIVAATNRQRAALLSGDRFRSDLYYRLAHAVYELPPLRERGDDIELLVEHFLDAFNRAEGKRAALNAATRRRLLQHPWPGNVRQLQAVIRKLVVAARADGVITPRDLPPLEEAGVGATFAAESQADEKRRILRALEQANFVKTDAAAILRISRTTLVGKLKRMGIEA